MGGSRYFAASSTMNILPQSYKSLQNQKSFKDTQYVPPTTNHCACSVQGGGRIDQAHARYQHYLAPRRVLHVSYASNASIAWDL